MNEQPTYGGVNPETGFTRGSKHDIAAMLMLRSKSSRARVVDRLIEELARFDGLSEVPTTPESRRSAVNLLSLTLTRMKKRGFEEVDVWCVRKKFSEEIREETSEEDL